MFNKIMNNLKKYIQLSAKKQFYCFMVFILGYFSPMLGILLFIFFKLKNIDTLYRYIPLYGAAIALAYYVIMYWIAILI